MRYYMPRYSSYHSGWNKVALLTAVRNSPCSCPFSVSLHPPLAALNSEPRPGSLNSLSHGLRRASSLTEGAFWSMPKLLR